MKINNLPTLYVESLRDLYSAETQLVKALPKVAKAITNKDLKSAFEDHLEETKGQVKRLEEIFKMLGEDPSGHECAAMKGLIKEAEDLITDVTDPEVRDAALIGGAQKVEHYEIAGYGTANALAIQLGHDDHVKLLQLTLDEEGDCDTKLTRFALQEINDLAGNNGSRAKRNGNKQVDDADKKMRSKTRNLDAELTPQTK